jgi:hypothetical protein
MLSLTKCVKAKYQTLLMKMAIDSPNNEKAKENFDLHCNVQVMLGLVTILPIL